MRKIVVLVIFIYNNCYKIGDGYLFLYIVYFNEKVEKKKQSFQRSKELTRETISLGRDR